MGLFSKKNKEFSGSPTADDSSDNGNPKHNILHKRPPSNDIPATQTTDGIHPDPATTAGAGTGVGVGQSYEDGGFGAAGTRRADLAAADGAPGTGGMHDPYANTTGAGMGRQPASMSHQRDMALGAPGVMSNQVYEKSPTSGGPGGIQTVRDYGSGIGTGAGVTGVGAGAEMAGTAATGGATGAGQHGFTHEAGAGQGQRGFAQETIESARAKVRLAEEAEAGALALVAEARAAAKEAREIIERLVGQAEEESRLAAIKQKEAMGLRQETEHLGRI